METGVHVLPTFTKDTTDRNRTSPFAFTGNKFEFRMLGSSASVSFSNVVINTAVAEVLKIFADELENADNFDNALHDLVAKTIKNHKRIIFNGNGYDDAWVEEAKKRGLLNLKSTPDCLPYFVSDKNIKLFTSHKVFSETEMRARCEIMFENYSKLLNIETLTAIDMTKKQILPAVSGYNKEIAKTAIMKRELGADSSYEDGILKESSKLSGEAYNLVCQLENQSHTAEAIKDVKEKAVYYKDNVLVTMSQLRERVDALESMTSAKYWPYPSYGELLFGIK